MTPTSVRVIEAIVPDASKPDIRVKLLDTMAHDLRGYDHLTGRDGKGFTTCEGCRRILSWLFFHAPSGTDTTTATAVDDVKAKQKTQQQKEQERVDKKQGAPLMAHNGNKRNNKAARQDNHTKGHGKVI
jgi:hypothetical protein